LLYIWWNEDSGDCTAVSIGDSCTNCTALYQQSSVKFDVGGYDSAESSHDYRTSFSIRLVKGCSQSIATATGSALMDDGSASTKPVAELSGNAFLKNKLHVVYNLSL